MAIGWRRALFVSSLVCAAVPALTSCHHEGGGVPGGPSATPSSFPTLTTTTSVTLSTSGGSVPLSSTGLSATLFYPSNNGGSGTYTVTTAEPSLTTLPTGTPFVYAELQLTSAVNFNGYFDISSVTIPTSLLVLSSSNTFTETVYDQSTGAQIGSSVNGTVSGQTIAFGTIGSANFAATTDVYVFVISYQ